MPATSPVLHIDNLTKCYGDLRVLDGVSLEVASGEVVSIIGSSGSGKSTCLRCIVHLELPTSGRIVFRGEVVGVHERQGVLVPLDDRKLSRQRQRIGMVFQRFNLFPHLTALENIMEAPVQVKGVARSLAARQARDLLARVGLADKDNAYPSRLSGGQQQRVAIARALAMEPELMLFDEATSALDPELVGDVLQVIRALADDGMTMVLVTHEMSFAREVSDRIVVFDGGKMVEQGEPGELFARPRHPKTIALLRGLAARPTTL